MTLTLKRKALESIEITVPPSTEPTKIFITVTRISGFTASLGFDAPRKVEVLRSEAIRRHPRESVESTVPVSATIPSQEMAQSPTETSQPSH